MTTPRRTGIGIALLLACSLSGVSSSQDVPLDAAALTRQLDDRDYHVRDDACAGLMALIRKQPDQEHKRLRAVQLVQGIRAHFFETHKHLPKLMLEEESDHAEWITDSFARVHANQIPKYQPDYVEIAFEDVLCRIRGLRLEAIHGRKEGMVAVDAGKYLAGSTREEVDEVKPLVRREGMHVADYVESEFLYERVREIQYPFYISREPVSVGEFRAFLADTKHPLESEPDIRKNQIPENPVFVGINEARALLYLYWAGRRLPSEEEWEKAGRGIYGRRYAPGNRTDPKMHLNPREGGVTGWPHVTDFEPLCKRPVNPAKRRYFAGPFGARSFGLFFEATDGTNRRPIGPEGAWKEQAAEPDGPRVLPPRRTDMYSGGGTSGWVVRCSPLKGGTIGLPSTHTLFPRVAARNQARGNHSESGSVDAFLFFRTVLDIPEYGRHLVQEATIRVKPAPGKTAHWVNTGIEIEKGDGLVFRAKGTVYGPKALQVGPLGKPVAPPEVRKVRVDDEFALVGMIGLDIVWGRFFIGRSWDTVAHNDGELFLGVNRSAGAGLTGAFTVTVQVYRK